MSNHMQQVYAPRLSHPPQYPTVSGQGLGVGAMDGPPPTLGGPPVVAQSPGSIVENGLGPPPVPGMGTGVPGPQPSQPNQKDFNTALLCRIGQETVQEIVSKTTEIFQLLKLLQLPNGTPQSMTGQEDRKAKLQDGLRNVTIFFKRLRRIYEKCNENCAGMEYTHIESLVPMKDENDPKEDRKTGIKYSTEEHSQLVEAVTLKNRQLKEVIDNLRQIIWDINTMLAMRKHLRLLE